MNLLRLLLRWLWTTSCTGLRVQVDVWGIVATLFVWAVVIGLWALAAAKTGPWVLLIGALLSLAWLLAWARAEGVSTDEHGPTVALDEAWEEERRDRPFEDPLYPHRTLGPQHRGIEL